MASLNIDRLLEACIKMGGSDLHLTVGRPPVLRISGRLRSLDTKVLQIKQYTTYDRKLHSLT